MPDLTAAQLQAMALGGRGTTMPLRVEEEGMRIVNKMAVVAVFLSLASAAARAESSKPPCQLLTKEQISTALGVNVDAGAVLPTVSDSCVWRESGKAATEAPMLVQVQRLSVQLYDRTKMVRAQEMTPQEGIGSEAYFYKDPITGYQLIVKVGSNNFLVVSTLPFPRYQPGAATDEKCKAIEREVARALAGKR